MKLLDIMKKYDRCLVRESAKLTKIYNMLLKEAADDGADLDEMDLDEEKCPDCGNDPCTCDEAAEDVDECGDADKLIPEDEIEKSDEVKENDMLRNRPHNGHIDDPAGIIPESEFFGEAEKAAKEEKEDKEVKEKEEKDKEDKEVKKEDEKEDDEMMSAAEFFAEAEKEKKDDMVPESEFFAEGGDDSEMQSAEEFFSAATTEVPEKNDEEAAVKEDEDKEPAEADKNEKIDEQELNFVPAEEWIQQQSEEVLEESLKSYRRKNHRLFNA